MLARAVGDEMSKSLGQPVIVENRAGAGGNTGADAVAKADARRLHAADVVGRHPHRQSVPLCARCRSTSRPRSFRSPTSPRCRCWWSCNPKVEAKTLKEFVALAKAQPGKLNFGSPGIGTTGHLGLAMLMHAAQIEITHVPYRGAAPAVTDLIAGQIDGVVDNPPTVIAHIQAGKLRPLAVAAKQRMALLPDVPTAAEAGVANYEASSWFGIAAPAGTPPAVVARLHKAIAAAVRTPAMQERFGKIRRAAGRRQPAGVCARRSAPSARPGARSSRRPASRRSSPAGSVQGPSSPGALAWIASAWTPPASSPDSV